jgi:hypothetical protein
MKLQIRAGFQSSFILALSIHLAVLLLFSFTFAVPEISPKPVFVFLGSFLRQQDVLLPSEIPAAVHTGFDLRQVHLDSDRRPWPAKVQKPSLSEKASPGEKSQFKPKVAEAIAPPKSQKTDASDLGIDLESLPPVKMKINPQ